MKKNSQTSKENVKKKACGDALLNLNETFTSLINAECYTEAGYVLSTMRDITDSMAEDYEEDKDDDDDDDDDEDDDY